MTYVLRRYSPVAFSALICLLLWASCDNAGDNTASSSPELEPNEELVPFTVPKGFTAEVFADGLDLPTSIAFPPDGSNRLFVNELQTGRIRIIEDGELLEEPFAQVQTNTSGGFPVDGENGLLGIAFDPDYTANGHVYVTYATRIDSLTLGTVARFTDVGNTGDNHTVLLDSVRSAPGHQIESLAFGPDGKLYVSTGDAYIQDAVQDAHSLLGKILRMNPDGSIPDDNPFSTYTYAYGFRNCFDLVFDDQGNLFTSDNGPSFNDELNRVVAGGNYGWPQIIGETSTSEFENPLYVWPEIVAPAGMVFYEETQFPDAYRGKLFLVLFGPTASPEPSPRAKRVQVVDVGDGTTTPAFDDFIVYNVEERGNPLDLAVDPDGSLYVSDIFQGKIFRISHP